jgi:hypothetical protein
MRLFPHRTAQEEIDDTLTNEVVEEAVCSSLSDDYLYMSLQNPRPGLTERIARVVRNAHLPIEYSEIKGGLLYRIPKNKEHLLKNSFGMRSLEVPGMAAMYFSDLPKGMFGDNEKSQVFRFKWKPIT